MDLTVVLPAVTAVLALVFSLALFDQWWERRGGFQLIWALGMLFYGIAAGAEALAGSNGWNEALYRVWYLTGAIWTAGWLGLGTAYLLGRTRFGYTFALCLVLAGVFTLLTQRRYDYPGAGSAPFLYLIAALVLALAIAVETYFQNERWPRLAAGGGGRGDAPERRAHGHDRPAARRATRSTRRPACPVGDLFPGTIRLLTPFMNITGAFALILGAVFSTYVFMPKKRVLPYSLDPNQPGDEFLFNLLIAPVAIAVNLVASLPGALRRAGDRDHPLARPGHDPHRHRGVHPDHHRQPQPVRVDGAVPAGQVPRRHLPVRRLPRVDRRVPRDPRAVHRDPAGHGPARVRRRARGRRPDAAVGEASRAADRRRSGRRRPRPAPRPPSVADPATPYHGRRVQPDPRPPS